MIETVAPRRKWLPRQKYVAPMFIGYALIVEGWAGFSVGRHDASVGLLVGVTAIALVFAAIGWGMAASIPDEEEIESVRKQFDKRIARLQERRP